MVTRTLRWILDVLLDKSNADYENVIDCCLELHSRPQNSSLLRMTQARSQKRELWSRMS